MRIFNCLVCCVALQASCVSFGCFGDEVTYVDASWGTGGNTTQWNGGGFSAFTPAADQSGIDNLWRQRAFGNSASILEAGGDISGDGNNNLENVPRLRTQISGLNAGLTYNVYAYFWSAISGVSPDWRLEAGLTDPGPSTNLSLFTRLGEGGAIEVISNNSFTTNVVFAEGNRRLYQAGLGIAMADSFGEISVYIDDQSPRPDFSQDNRTWYDGVGYSVIPEPSTLALLFTGSSFVLIGRRRRA